jgi:hypothetical protein
MAKLKGTLEVNATSLPLDAVDISLITLVLATMCAEIE